MADELILELEPVPAEDAADAFARAVTVAAAYYGVEATLDLPGGVDGPALASNLAALSDEVAKAVAAHHSHFQPRVRGGQFTRRHPGNLNPREVTGRFRQRLTRAEMVTAAQEAKDLIAEFTDRLQDHLADLDGHAITPPTFEARCERDIRLFYREIYRRGKQAAGDPGIVLGPQDTAALNRLAADEMDFLRKFAADMAAGAGTMPYADRMDWYGKAAREAAWMGWVLGDQRVGRELQWVLGPTEHCNDCLRFSQMGWTPVRRFTEDVLAKGFLPQSGQLECHGYHCQCAIQERLAGRVQPGVVWQ